MVCAVDTVLMEIRRKVIAMKRKAANSQYFNFLHWIL